MAKDSPKEPVTNKQAEAKTKALDTALAQIERQFGKGSVMKMGEKAHEVMEVIPTGSIALDVALGIGEIGRAHV